MKTRYLTPNRLFFVWIALAFLIAWGSAPAHAAQAREVRVAVASNFIKPMEQLAARFSAISGYRVVVSAGSTGKLYAQIKNGAPFDVFLAANTREPERLETDGGAVSGSRFTYAQGRLALWCPTAQSATEARACLDQPNARIAIANPRLAPYGQAAQAALSAIGVLADGRIVSGENIAQAFQLVWSGNVPMGFVALSQVKAFDGVKGAYWVVPSDLHAPIDQQAVLLNRARDTPPAQAFVEFLKSDAARVVITDFGYDVSLQLAEHK